jgi:haloacetate dehalogenase
LAARPSAAPSGGLAIGCPLLVLWGTRGIVGGPGENLLSLWQQYATDVRGSPPATGHFLAEEAPDLVITALRGFLS